METEPFRGILALPDQETTLGGEAARSSTTQGFGVVLPVPRSGGDSPPARLQPGSVLNGSAEEVGAGLVQNVGRTFVLYRAAEEPVIQLPE